MENDNDAGLKSIDTLRRALADIATTASPRVAELARWAQQHPEEMAFHSVRGLAQLADVNPNSVFRLARALGFDGYDACRLAFQQALRGGEETYADRAARLRHTEKGALFDALQGAAIANLNALFDTDMSNKLDTAATMLLSARQIHCIGVRSCYSIAHYFAYTGRMAFPTFAPVPSAPGAIADALTATGPSDVVVPISYALYSAEAIEAHRIATARGARILAVTDMYSSPLAQGAEIVLTPQMHGPQVLPSLLAYFALAEALVARMVSGSPEARGRIAEFETRLTQHGIYKT
ncbi:transcriptional regulator, RpiR family [Roseibacterium elongatum DSM 19469]|uniref:Transcriptional regulator, RpiR family n=1 Tax=Roseicyclus elongatus DSM 19469 TaxID=1294273 RepID=W8S311_9RHOB|nr:MurR/RpiR family transcriptional regulator [Roseibacterium elongatum]AHM03141.1 transcriptional regulator, RpiR family [Roseibacterium elongatum DSM 19469]